MGVRPTGIQIDLSVEAAYVTYSDELVASTIDVWEDGQIAADVDDCGEVVGIEILGFDDETLREARAFADQKGLGFPVNLAGVLVVA